MKIRNADRQEKIELQMTPMIDIVFQLLIFFIMTFRIVLPEGDFNIRMPLAANQPTAEPSETPTLNLAIEADASGNLAELRLGGISFGSDADAFVKLHRHIRGLINDEGGPGTASEQELEIDADFELRYEHTLRAITAITGYLENGKRHALIEKVRFAAPQQ